MEINWLCEARNCLGLEPDRYGRKKMREDASSSGRSEEEWGKGVQRGDKVKSPGGK